MAPQGIIIGALREIIVYTTQKKGAISVKTAHKRREPIDLTQGPCWKVILLFSLPVILSYLLQQVYSISDAAIVGQTLTAAEVAGVNDTNSLVFIFLQFAFGVSAGFCVITSYYVGMHDERGVRRSLATQLLLSAALTVVLTALALVLLDPMLAWINVTPAHHEVYTAAHTYCAIIFAGIGAQLFYNFICSFLRAMGDSVTPLLFLLFSTVLNVGLDLAFILVFRWGVAGAALATVLAQLVSTIGCFIYAFVRYPVLRLHREDWRITLMDVKRHLVRGIPLGLQFSVLAIGIIVMQGGVVQFDMRDGVMVSNAAQNGFGAANRLFNLVATPMNALGGAMTSFTAQNLGAGQYDRIRRGTLQALGMVSILAILAAGTGLLLTRGDFCYHVFLSADKVTPDAVRYGNSLLYVDFSMYLFLGFVFVVRNCVQGIGRSGFVLGAGAAELVARITVCLVLPGLFAGGAVSADAPAMAFYALCAAPHGVDRGGYGAVHPLLPQHHQERLPVLAAQPSVTAALSSPAQCAGDFFVLGKTSQSNWTVCCTNNVKNQAIYNNFLL